MEFPVARKDSVTKYIGEIWKFILCSELGGAG